MSTYTDWKHLDDEHVITMLQVSDEADLRQSFADALQDDWDRAERLRSRLDSATAADFDDGRLRAEDGRTLDGQYTFHVLVSGWLTVYAGGEWAASLPDDQELPLDTTGTLTISYGALVDREITLPPAAFGTPPVTPSDVVESAVAESPSPDWNQIQQANIEVLNAMFVAGAGPSQREVRVFTDESSMVVKNIHDQSDEVPLDDPGVGTIRFTYNKWSPNEILIANTSDLDCELVQDRIRDWLDKGWLSYPYRDRKRISFVLQWQG